MIEASISPHSLASCALASKPPQASCSGRCNVVHDTPARRRVFTKSGSLTYGISSRNAFLHYEAPLSLRCARNARSSFTRRHHGLPIRCQQQDDSDAPFDASQRQAVYDRPRVNGGAPPRNYSPRQPPPEGPLPEGGGGISNLTKAFVAGAFILGMGAGIWFDSEVTFAPQNVASTVLVDTKTPNSEVCMANGYSSMVFDQRIFVSFNPFNVYVAQPEVKPGCVLRRANFNVLESRGLVDSQQVQACKRNMNTFAFIGDLTGRPQVSCVYHSEEAENQFLKNPPKEVTSAAAAAATAAGSLAGQ
jgi:hypothetical protein